MLGIDPNTQHDRMAEALDVILRLFREIVTEKTEWHTLANARAHLLPHTKQYPQGRGGQRGDSVRRPSGREA